VNDTVKRKLALLPDKPGSYQMLDRNKQIIYVGKAKNLRNRVKSYFVGSHDQKTQSLVSNIEDFTYIVTKSELEAFLLELSLIKEHSPRFNIMLMDDKSYPYIEVTNEKYPKIIITRKPSKKAKLQYGPFPDVFSARNTLQILNRIFPFRKCQTLPKKVCLYYHIGQCLGPCEFPVDETVYEDLIRDVKKFMSGQNNEIVQKLKEEMNQYSSNLEFEKAQEIKELLESIEKTLERQQIIFKDMKNRDIFAYQVYDQYMSVCTLFMRQGKITFSENHLFQYTELEDAFLSFIGQFYENKPLPDEILLPESMDYSLLGELLENKIVIPQKGSKHSLIDTAAENAGIYLQNNIDLYLKKHEKTIGATTQLGELLGIDTPRRIEAFDNSNLMGKDAVSGMVVFINGLPSKKNYRKYHVKSVDKADDFHTMQEVLYRRYQRMLMEDSERPDLIMMDGGITQVHAAKEILSSLHLEIPVIGLQKNEKHRTDLIIDLNENDLIVDKHSSVFFLISKIQEEVHRFAITFHRSVRGNQIYASLLDAIPEIGKATKQKLLIEFKTIENIKNATDEELKKIGLNKKQIENIRIALV